MVGGAREGVIPTGCPHASRRVLPAGVIIRSPRLGHLVAALWAGYYFAFATIGHNPDLTRPIIWYGGLFVGLVTLFVFSRSLVRISREAKLLLLFWFWATLGSLLIAALGNGPFSVWYSRLILQYVLIMVLLTAVMRATGQMKWMWASFVLVPVYHLVSHQGSMRGIVFQIAESTTRLGINSESGENTLGWYGFMGLLGALVLLGEAKRTLHRVLLVAGGIFGISAVVASASRGGFVAVAISIVLWPIMCLRVRTRQKALLIAVSAIMFLAAWAFKENVYQDSYLHVRMANIQREQQLEHGRFNLLKASANVVLEHPIVGVGLGNFGRASGTAMYAHTEAAELLTTTGLVGFCIYMSVYWVAWRRLTLGFRKARDPLVKYQINCARMGLIVVVVSGVLFKPHFLVISSMFLISLIVGTGLWANPCDRNGTSPDGLPVFKEAGLNRGGRMIDVGFPPSGRSVSRPYSYPRKVGRRWW